MVRARNSFDGRNESDRGVSEVIGSILVFGLLIALLALVQTQVVPNANEDVEVAHAADVQGDMTELQASISRSAALASTESTTVRTGMTYPTRLVLFNPPPVQGTLSTGGTSQVALSGIAAVNDDTDDFVGSGLSYDTHAFSYRVDYNRYRNAPTTRYEHGVLVNDFGKQVTVESPGSLVSGNRISLTLLRGGLQESQVKPASVTTYPVSAPPRTVRVEPAGTRPTLAVPTRIPEEVWLSEILLDQIDPTAFSGGPPTDCDSLSTSSPATNDERYIVGCSYTENPNAPNELVLTFQKASAEYELRAAKVGFSAASDPPAPAYVTEVTPPDANTAVVEVRDRFNNPIQRSVVLKVETRSGTRTVRTAPDGRADVGALAEERKVYLKGNSNNCDSISKCATVGPVVGSAASAVRVTAVRQKGSTDTTADIVFEFSNTGQDPTEITRIQLGYATQRTEQEVTVSAGGAITGKTSTTLVEDGPDSIQEVTYRGTTYTPTSPSGTPTGAKENLAPVEFTDKKGNLPTVPTTSGGSPPPMVLSLNEPVSTASKDSVDLSVTIYYADGSSATYSRTLFDDEGENGQRP